MKGFGPVFNILLIVTCAAFVLLFAMAGDQANRDLRLATLVLAAAITGCLAVCREVFRRDQSMMDPFLLLVAFVTINTFPTVFCSAVMTPARVIEKGVTLGHPEILGKSTVAHAVFLVAAAMIYYVLYPKKAEEETAKSATIYYDKMWIYMALVLLACLLVIGSSIAPNFFSRWETGASWSVGRYIKFEMGMLKGQLLQKLEILVDIALSFSIGVFACRARSLRQARFRLLSLCALYFLFIFLTTTDRGQAITVGIAAVSLADTVRWRGRLLNARIFAVIILLGLVLSSLTGAVEDKVIYGKYRQSRTKALERKIVLDYSQNRVTGDIILWIDNKVVEPAKFKTLRDAVRNIVPAQLRSESRVQSLAEWYAYQYNPVAARMGQGYGFCTVAEGYLNYGMFGVAVEGLIVGIICSFIVSFKKRRWTGIYGPFMFSSYMTIVYRLYNGHLENALKSIEWLTILSVFLFVCFNILVQRGYVGNRYPPAYATIKKIDA